MRVLVALSLAALSACASSTVSTGSPPSESVHIAGQSGALTLTSGARENVTHLAIPIERVWLSLPAAFEALSIPITGVDTANHVIRNDGLKVRRQLGKVPLGRFIDCGSTQVGENADSYDVYLTVVTQLRRDPEGTTSLATILEAMAKPVNFSRDYSRCSSRGVLETRLAEAAKVQLQ